MFNNIYAYISLRNVSLRMKKIKHIQTKEEMLL